MIQSYFYYVFDRWRAQYTMLNSVADNLVTPVYCVWYYLRLSGWRAPGFISERPKQQGGAPCGSAIHDSRISIHKDEVMGRRQQKNLNAACKANWNRLACGGRIVGADALISGSRRNPAFRVLIGRLTPGLKTSIPKQIEAPVSNTMASGSVAAGNLIKKSIAFPAINTLTL